MERVPCLQSPSLMLRSRENKCKVRIINGSFYPCASRMPVVSLASILNIRVSNNIDRQIIIKSSNLSTLDPILKDATHFQRLGHWTEKTDVPILMTMWAEGPQKYELPRARVAFH